MVASQKKKGLTIYSTASWRGLQQKVDGNDHEIIRQHLAKYRSLMPSLALIFHLLDLVDERNRLSVLGNRLSSPFKRALGDAAIVGERLEPLAPMPPISSSPISWRAALMSIRWCRYLESHARRVYAMSMDSAYAAAHALATHLRAGELADGFTARDVYRKGWAGLNSKEDAESAIRELVDAGWLRQRPRERSTTGRRPGAAYDINPAVHGHPQ